MRAAEPEAAVVAVEPTSGDGDAAGEGGVAELRLAGHKKCREGSISDGDVEPCEDVTPGVSWPPTAGWVINSLAVG